MKLPVIAAVACLCAGLFVWSATRRDSTQARLPVPHTKFRVCADPNNLPFSNDRGEGFENRIAEVIARELNAELEYVWWAQRRGFIRNTIRAGTCDVWMSLPAEMDMLLMTRPYYRSAYVFITRTEDRLTINSLDAAELKRLRIGVQIIGDDYSNSPPAHLLASRGIVNNVRGFSVVGNYSDPNPPSDIIRAVASGGIDVAIAWGPMAGFFAHKQKRALTIHPITPGGGDSQFPLAFDIAMGVRRSDKALQLQLEAALDKRGTEIQRILAEYHVPLAPPKGS